MSRSLEEGFAALARVHVVVIATGRVRADLALLVLDVGRVGDAGGRGGLAVLAARNLRDRRRGHLGLGHRGLRWRRREHCTHHLTTLVRIPVGVVIHDWMI